MPIEVIVNAYLLEVSYSFTVYNVTDQPQIVMVVMEKCHRGGPVLPSDREEVINLNVGYAFVG